MKYRIIQNGYLFKSQRQVFCFWINIPYVNNKFEVERYTTNISEAEEAIEQDKHRRKPKIKEKWKLVREY
jgi:hypothetical protein